MDTTKGANKITIQLLFATLIVAGITLYTNANHISTFFKAGSDEKNISVLFVPNDLQAASGTPISFTPFVNSTTKKPGFIRLTLKFDTNSLIYKGTDDTQTSVNFESIIPPELVDNTVTLTYAIKDATLAPGDTIQLAKLLFETKNDQESRITLDVANSEVVFLDSDTGVINEAVVTVNTQKETEKTTEKEVEKVVEKEIEKASDAAVLEE